MCTSNNDVACWGHVIWMDQNLLSSGYNKCSPCVLSPVPGRAPPWIQMVTDHPPSDPARNSAPMSFCQNKGCGWRRELFGNFEQPRWSVFVIDLFMKTSSIWVFPSLNQSHVTFARWIGFRTRIPRISSMLFTSNWCAFSMDGDSTLFVLPPSKLLNPVFVLFNSKSICRFAGWWFGCHVLFSQKYWVANHPNWRTHIFQRAFSPTTNQCSCWIKHVQLQKNLIRSIR